MARIRYLDDESVVDTNKQQHQSSVRILQPDRPKPRIRYLDDNSVAESQPAFSTEQFNAQYQDRFDTTQQTKPISPRAALEQSVQRDAAKLRGEVVDPQPTADQIRVENVRKYYGGHADEYSPQIDLLINDFPEYSKRIDAEVKKGRDPSSIRKIIIAEQEAAKQKLKTKETPSGTQVDAGSKINEFVNKYESETDPSRKEKLRTIIKRLGSMNQSEGSRGVKDAQRQELIQQGENIYSTLKGAAAGATLGLSNAALNPLETSQLGGAFEPSTTTGKALETGSQLASGIATGQRVAKGIASGLAKTALSKGAQTALTSAGVAALQTGVNSAVESATGNYPKEEALKDIVQNVTAAIASLGVSKLVPHGSLNAVAQVAGDFLYDLGTDTFFRDRLKDQSFKDWFVKQELPQLITSGTFAVKGYKDHQATKRQVLSDAVDSGVVQPPSASESVASRESTSSLPRKFLTRSTQETDAPPDVVKALESVEPQTYQVHKTSKEFEATKEWLKSDPSNVTKAEESVYSNEAPSAKKAVMGIALLDKYRKEGNVDAEVKLTDHLDRQFRESGRHIQAASLWSSMTGAAQKKSFRNFIKSRKLNLPENVLKDVDSRFDAAARKTGKEREQAVADAVTYATQYVPVRFGDKFDAFRYTNMLSNPRAHERNIVGNLFNAAIIRPSSLIMQGEIKGAGRYLKGAGESIGDALAAAKDAWGKSASSKLVESGLSGKSAFDAAMSQKLPKSLTAIGRALEAQDRFFASLIEGGEKSRLLAKGTDPKVADKQARQLSEKYLYRDPLGVGMRDTSLNVFSRALDGLGYGVDKMRNLPGVGPVMRPFLPFIKTPINVAKFGIEASPLAFAGRPMTRNNIAKAKYGKVFERLSPDERATVSTELRERQGLAAAGSLVTAVGGILAASGRTTWAPPKDEKAKELFYASGRKPYSILIGNKWVPMATFGPLALALGIPAAARDAYYDNPDTVSASWDNKLLDVAGGLARYISSQTPLQGLGSFLDVINGNEDASFGKAMGFMATQVIPASGLVRYVNQWIDPQFRKARGFFDSIQRDWPILSQKLEPYSTPEGKPAERTVLDVLPPYSVGSQDNAYESAFQERIATLKDRAANNAEIEQLIRLYQRGKIDAKEVSDFIMSRPKNERNRLRSRTKDLYNIDI